MRTLNINEIIDRYNDAFGWMAMKVAPRLIQAGLGGANFMLMDIEGFDTGDASFADMLLKSNHTGKEYFFGVGSMGDSRAALPFQKPSISEASRYLAPPPMVRFRRGKNVVKTGIDNSPYEVIENFGLRPWDIEMSGIVVDVENHAFPRQLMREINDMFTTPGTFQVTGDIFNTLEVNEIFFESDFEVGFVEGYKDTVKFSVKAISTAPVPFLLDGF